MKVQEQIERIADQFASEFGTANIHKVLGVPSNATLNTLKTSSKKYVQMARYEGTCTQSQIETLDRIHFLLESPATLLNYILLPQVRAEYLAHEKIVKHRRRLRCKLIYRLQKLTSKCERQNKELETSKELIEIKDKLLSFYSLLDTISTKGESKCPKCSRTVRNSTPLANSGLIDFAKYTANNYVLNDVNQQQEEPNELEHVGSEEKQTDHAKVKVDLEETADDNYLDELLKSFNEKLSQLDRLLALEIEKNDQLVAELASRAEELQDATHKINLIQSQLKFHEKSQVSLKTKEQEIQELHLSNQSLEKEIALMERRIKVMKLQKSGVIAVNSFTLLSLVLILFMLIILMVLMNPLGALQVQCEM